MSTTLTRKQALAIREALEDAQAEAFAIGQSEAQSAHADDERIEELDTLCERIDAALKLLPEPTPIEAETLRCERDQLKFC